MRAAEVLARVGAGFPHAQDEPLVLRELTRAENMVKTEVLGLPLPEADEVLTAEDALAVSSPYDGLYEHYVTAMLAEMQGETARYNNAMGLFAALYAGYAKAYRRTHLPARGAEVGFRV